MFKQLLPDEFRVSLKYSVIVNPAIAACFQYIFYMGKCLLTLDIFYIPYLDE